MLLQFGWLLPNCLPWVLFQPRLPPAAQERTYFVTPPPTLLSFANGLGGNSTHLIVFTAFVVFQMVLKCTSHCSWSRVTNPGNDTLAGGPLLMVTSAYGHEAICPGSVHGTTKTFSIPQPFFTWLFSNSPLRPGLAAPLVSTPSVPQLCKWSPQTRSPEVK